MFGAVNAPANPFRQRGGNNEDDDESEDGEEEENEGEGQQNNGAPIVSNTLDIVLRAFDDYCLPRKNIAMESYKFNTVVQKENQTFAHFETELRTQLRFCEYNCNCGATY